MSENENQPAVNLYAVSAHDVTAIEAAPEHQQQMMHPGARWGMIWSLATLFLCLPASSLSFVLCLFALRDINNNRQDYLPAAKKLAILGIILSIPGLLSLLSLMVFVVIYFTILFSL